MHVIKSSISIMTEMAVMFVRVQEYVLECIYPQRVVGGL